MSTEWLLNALANRVGIDKGACVKHSNVPFAILSGVKENLAYVVGILVLRWFTKSHNLFFVQELKKQPGFALQNDDISFCNSPNDSLPLAGHDIDVPKHVGSLGIHDCSEYFLIQDRPFSLVTVAMPTLFLFIHFGMLPYLLDFKHGINSDFTLLKKVEMLTIFIHVKNYRVFGHFDSL